MTKILVPTSITNICAFLGLTKYYKNLCEGGNPILNDDTIFWVDKEPLSPSIKIILARLAGNPEKRRGNKTMNGR
jgi:uncharacterized protein (DUF427 family)